MDVGSVLVLLFQLSCNCNAEHYAVKRIEHIYSRHKREYTCKTAEEGFVGRTLCCLSVFGRKGAIFVAAVSLVAFTAAITLAAMRERAG